MVDYKKVKKLLEKMNQKENNNNTSCIIDLKIHPCKLYYKLENIRISLNIFFFYFLISFKGFLR